MRYIIIGLGFSGSSLAAKLTSLGQEVIGIGKLDSIKRFVD